MGSNQYIYSSCILLALFVIFNIGEAGGGGSKKTSTVNVKTSAANNIREVAEMTGDTSEDVIAIFDNLDDLPPAGGPVLFSKEANENVFDLEYNQKISKKLDKAKWKQFWRNFLKGCKASVLESWLKKDFDKRDPGGSGGAGGAQAIVANWNNNRREAGAAIPVYVAAHQSYVAELADFYYDEKVEEARSERSWLVLNEQRKRADRAAAHGSVFADDLLYDYYENVDVETQRKQSAIEKLEEEKKEVRQKRDEILAERNLRQSLRRKHIYNQN